MTAARLAARIGSRAGGLAIAAGIGAAIASAAPAWAAPDDGNPAQASAAESTPSAARATHAGKRSASGRSAKSAKDTPSAAATPIPAATIQTATPKTAPVRRSLRTLPGPAAAVNVDDAPAATPGRRIAVGRSALNASPVNAAETQSGPIHDLLATLFPWFDPRGQRIFVLKGWQYSLPPQYAFFVNKVSGHATFTEDSAYDVQNVDQYDWLKLTGITFTPWRPDTDAIMVAWRYNLDTEMFEIGPYYNSDLARIMPNEDEIISVPAGQEFDFSLNYDGITLSYGDETVFKPLPESLHPRIWTAVRINGWFGGTSPAPRTVSYYLHLNCF